MCRFLSMVVTQGGEVFSPGNDVNQSHGDLIKAHGLNDAVSLERRQFVRVEVTFRDGKPSRDVKDAVFAVDEENEDALPEWWKEGVARYSQLCLGEWSRVVQGCVFFEGEHEAHGTQVVFMAGVSRAVLWGNSRAELWENSSAVLWENSSAVLRENSRAVLWGNSRAVLWENSSAVLRENSSAELRENSRAVLWENSSAVLWENSRAELRENSRAVLRENSSAVLWENSRAVLRENSSAVLRENSSAELWGNSRAELRENSSAELNDLSVARKNGVLYVTKGVKVKKVAKIGG